MYSMIRASLAGTYLAQDSTRRFAATFLGAFLAQNDRAEVSFPRGSEILVAGGQTFRCSREARERRSRRRGHSRRQRKSRPDPSARAVELDRAPDAMLSV